MRLGQGMALALLLVLSALTGCIGGGDTDELTGKETPGDLSGTTTIDGEAATPAQGFLGATGEIERPSWEVGQWFGYHVFFGQEDDEGIHYDSVVVEDQGGSWLLATADSFVSKIEAVEDLPVLGTFSKQDLSTTNQGEPWSMYSFPLQDNKTWTETFSFPGPNGTESFEVSFTASYNPEIALADGTAPGFDIVGTTQQGATFLEYDYVPEVGWFAHMFIYDPFDDTGSWDLHLMTMGHGTGWTGTAYVDEATQVLDHTSHMAAGAPPYLEPSPHAAFEVSGSATHVYAFAYSFAFTGAHDTSLVSPDGEHYPMPVTAGVMSTSVSSLFLLTEAIPGGWEVVTAGAGMAAGGGVFVWEMVETPIELVDGKVQAPA